MMNENTSRPDKVYESGVATDVVMGENVTVVMPSNLYGCELSHDTFVGPFCEIQRDVTIGPRTRIQSHCFICSKVSIGADCFIAHGVLFTNDRFKSGEPSYDDVEWEATIIHDNVSIGSGVTLLPVTIASGVIVGAGSVVTKDLNEPGTYAGNPARLVRRLEQ